MAAMVPEMLQLSMPDNIGLIETCTTSRAMLKREWGSGVTRQRQRQNELHEHCESYQFSYKAQVLMELRLCSNFKTSRYSRGRRAVHLVLPRSRRSIQNYLAMVDGESVHHRHQLSGYWFSPYGYIEPTSGEGDNELEASPPYDPLPFGRPNRP